MTRTHVPDYLWTLKENEAKNKTENISMLTVSGLCPGFEIERWNPVKSKENWAKIDQ